MAFQAPLQPVDWKVYKERASQFQRDHPTIRIADLTWEERITTPGAKESYAVHTSGLHRQDIEELGCMPCSQCGLITSSWCEACEGYNVPAFAICTRCDKGRVVCPTCVAAKRLYAEHQSTVPPSVMQIGGFQTDKGYVTLTPPLKLDVSEIPVVDGSFDWDFISQRMHDHREANLHRRSAAGSPHAAEPPIDQFDS